MTRKVEIIDKKEFVKVILDKNSKISVVYIVALKVKESIYKLWII